DFHVTGVQTCALPIYEAGVDPAQLETWEGLREAGEQLTGDGVYGIGLFGQAYESLTVVMNSFVFSNGGDILDENGQCALDEPERSEERRVGKGCGAGG